MSGQGYHGSPCVKDCPDRGAGCTTHCPHGYAEWRAERGKLYDLRAEQSEKTYILDAGAKQQRNKYYRHQHNHGRR